MRFEAAEFAALLNDERIQRFALHEFAKRISRAIACNYMSRSRYCI